MVESALDALCAFGKKGRLWVSFDWIHEIKHDGYRLIVQREGKRVRLLTRKNRTHHSIDRVMDSFS